MRVSVHAAVAKCCVPESNRHLPDYYFTNRLFVSECATITPTLQKWTRLELHQFSLPRTYPTAAGTCSRPHAS